jgi:hypothetical protein
MKANVHWLLVWSSITLRCIYPPLPLSLLLSFCLLLGSLHKNGSWQIKRGFSGFCVRPKLMLASASASVLWVCMSSSLSHKILSFNQNFSVLTLSWVSASSLFYFLGFFTVYLRFIWSRSLYSKMGSFYVLFIY